MFTDPRSVLARHGLSPKRGFSQNFLCSATAVERIADAVGTGPEDRVVELGPGCGTLTAALLDRGASVVAIERDPDMRRVLEVEFGSARLTVRDGDATTTDYRALRTELGAPPRVVGNLPYAITGAILRRLMEDHDSIHSAVVMVQREVADRLLATPGGRTYGALSVFAQNVFVIRRVAKVPAGAFHPRPKVDSAVVALCPHGVAHAESPLFERVVRAAFQRRRKTLRNALGALPGFSATTLQQALHDAGVDPRARAEQLAVADFDRVAAALCRLMDR